jgi:hypothetical protein
MRRLWLLGFGAVLAMGSVVGAGAQESPSPASTAPVESALPEAANCTASAGTPGGRDISGTIRGIDDRAVNAQISLVLRDAQDRPIHMNGSVHGNRACYERTVSMNPAAPIDGLAAGGDPSWRHQQ